MTPEHFAALGLAVLLAGYAGLFVLDLVAFVLDARQQPAREAEFLRIHGGPRG